MRRESNLCLLPQPKDEMLAPISTISYTDLATALLTHYSFDLSGYKAAELVASWKSQFQVNWLHLAVIEALYQGRYKAFSVQQILNIWQRRGQATFHFNMEFERLICSKFPESLVAVDSSGLALPPVPQVPRDSSIVNSTQILPVSNTIQDIKYTEDNDNLYHNYKYKNEPSEQNTQNKQEQIQVIPEWAVIRKPPIPNIQIVEANSQSRVATQLVKMLPTATHRPPIEQFTPEQSDSNELFASKLKAIVKGE